MENSNGNYKIEKLFNFFILYDKLLYICDDFIGYDPEISKGFSYEKFSGDGTKINLYEFEMLKEHFNVITTFAKYSGPLRGYQRVEVLRKGTTIIMGLVGAAGHGGVFSNGKYSYIDDKNAYLLIRGIKGLEKYVTNKGGYSSILSGDDHYLIGFKNIKIPIKAEMKLEQTQLSEGDYISKDEIEVLRQIEWNARFKLKKHSIDIIKTSIPGIEQTYWSRNGFNRFIKCDGETALEKTEIYIDGDCNYVDEFEF